MASQTEPTQQWGVRALSRNVHAIDLVLPRVSSRARVLLQTDAHWDNPHCDQKLYYTHLDEALACNAPVIDGGDFFCAMQGKFDKRSSKSDLRPEHVKGDYLDSLVSTATKALKPYKNILTVRAQGNHETAIRKCHETDLTERLVERLRAEGSTTVHAGGFSGWVRFYLRYGGTRRASFDLWYHHGYGGGGPVTRGTIQTSRQAVYLANADIVLNGHTHDEWIMPIQRIRLNHQGNVEQCRQVHVRTPGYKDEYADGHGGWHIERGGPPKPIGAAWLEFFTGRDGKPTFEIREAR